jgi:hypothetical protein
MAPLREALNGYPQQVGRRFQAIRGGRRSALRSGQWKMRTRLVTAGTGGKRAFPWRGRPELLDKMIDEDAELGRQMVFAGIDGEYGRKPMIDPLPDRDRIYSPPDPVSCGRSSAI